MKRLLILLAFVAACSPIAKPPIVHPGPAPTITVQSNASIYDEGGNRVTDATCTVVHDTDSGATPPQETLHGWRIEDTYLSPPVHRQWAATVTCTSKDYLTTAKRYEPFPEGEFAFPPMKAAHAWGDESGWLTRSGPQFLDANGQAWRYRGYTAFRLLEQACNGQDVDPFIEDAVEKGARVFRVLGMYQPYIGTFTLARDDLPRYDACLLGLIHTLAAHGLRIEYVPFADAQVVMPDPGQQQQFFTHIWRLIDPEWNVLGELCNECEKNGTNPIAFSKPIGRVLWSRGSGLGGEQPPAPGWDYTTNHPPRDAQYPRKDDCRYYTFFEGSALRGLPCVEDEPMGASELDQPGRRAGAINGDASQAIRDFGQMGANFGLQGAGGLFHSDAGITGGLLGPVQAQMATAFFVGLNFPPAAAQTWPYMRGDNCGDCGGIGDMPLQQLDAFELRAFCRTQTATAWCVDIRGTRAPLPRAGWRILEEPIPGVLRLAR